MPQLTLSFPDLAEHANRVHPELKALVQEFSEADRARFTESAALCEQWIDSEFMKLLNALQLDGRLPNIDLNINASYDFKRVLTFTSPEGNEATDVRDTIQRAWAATVNAYTGALCYRAKEIATGDSNPSWTPDQTTSSPTL
ncbi:hypothetical protein [Acidipropionibacterium acidipropionici]|uniref:hypothetical protein n=1 Tax=Acidipropionibacterium acidipropionici TaxID=1748 RepID=UPI00048FE987|nr:hypothetical protein [Acidipropionibacterium acidipropionici]ALN16515.1 hypothetical protein ASQ49_15900 [Acidipropionibacterium acidipropionici]APZ10430.1 hypothetical protein BWX38_15595 [Acidipropionibacterium acidipropionici]